MEEAKELSVNGVTSRLVPQERSEEAKGEPPRKDSHDLLDLLSDGSVDYEEMRLADDIIPYS